MRFYGSGAVWDPQKNCILCRFENGVYDTVNKTEIDILKRNKFEHDPEPAPKPRSKEAAKK